MFCRGRLFIYACACGRPFVSGRPLPLPNLGFSLVGFTAFHSLVSQGLRHCGTFRCAAISCDLGFAPPLYAPIYLTLSFPLAQTLRASQPVRAWTFLWLMPAIVWVGNYLILVGSWPSWYNAFSNWPIRRWSSRLFWLTFKVSLAAKPANLSLRTASSISSS